MTSATASATVPFQLLPHAPDRRGFAPPPGIDVGALPEAARAQLEGLRKIAHRTRCGRQMTLAQAQRMLACPGAASGASEALVRTLGEVLGRRPVFHAPDCPQASFDEAWLVRCHTAQAAGDVDSLALLTRSRVPPVARRPFLDLLRAI